MQTKQRLKLIWIDHSTSRQPCCMLLWRLLLSVSLHVAASIGQLLREHRASQYCNCVT